MTKEEYFEIEKKLLPVTVEWTFERIDTSGDWSNFKGSARLIYDGRISTAPFSYSLGLSYIESWGYLSYTGRYALPQSPYTRVSVHIDKKKDVYMTENHRHFIKLQRVNLKERLLIFERNHVTCNGIKPTCAKVKSPSVWDVLECLTLDARCGMETFENFCGEFEYDEDSRKAYKMWESCKDIYIMLSKFLSHVGITLDQLEEYLRTRDEKEFSHETEEHTE